MGALHCTCKNGKPYCAKHTVIPQMKLKVYIAASWKHQHAVEMLTAMIRDRGHTVLSFVENNHGENPDAKKKDEKPVPFDEWVWGESGKRSFEYDTRGAMYSDLVIYLGPSGKDAAAELGMAYAKGVKIVGLHAKGEDFGLMRRIIEWKFEYVEILEVVDVLAGVFEGVCKKRISDHTDFTDCAASLPCTLHGTTAIRR